MASLPPLDAAKFPILSNPHTQAPFPGANQPYNTLGKCGMYGWHGPGPNNEVAIEHIQNLKGLYMSSQHYKLFIAKLLYFVFLTIKIEDVREYIIPEVHFEPLENCLCKYALESTGTRTPQQCFGDDNSASATTTRTCTNMYDTNIFSNLLRDGG